MDIAGVVQNEIQNGALLLLAELKVGAALTRNAGAVAERLLKALRDVRPGNVRQFFALANQHIRWALNDLARRLDEQPKAMDLAERYVPAPANSESGFTPEGRRMLDAIGRLPDDEREAFELVKLQE